MALHAELLAALAAGDSVVCPSAQRAAAVRAAWAAHQAGQGLTLWPTPDVLPFDAWAERLLDRQRDAGFAAPRLLSPVEQLLLWRDVGRSLVDRHDLQLLGATRLADALRNAVRVLQSYRIPEQRLARTDAAETQWLLACLRDLRQRCTALGARCSWMDIDAAGLPHAPDGGTIRLAGFGGRLTPAQQRFLDAFSAMGGVWSHCADPDTPAVVPRACIARDPADEVRQIARWCRGQLEQRAGARLLVVVGDLDARRAITERALIEELDPPGAWQARESSPRCTIEGGSTLASAPLVARQLDLLAVLMRPLERDDWIRWLQSWQAGSSRDACREQLLRTARQWQGPAMSLADLLRRAGLAAAPPADDAPWLERLRRAAAGLQAPRQRTHDWARAYATALGILESGAPVAADSATHQLQQRWNELLEDYAGAHELVGPVDAGTAYGQLRALAQRTRFAPEGGSAAVTVTPNLDDPVIGYDGIWVAGMTADLFPAPPRIDPYVPWALQVEFGVAAAIPERCLEAARGRLAAWRRSTPELILSFAAESGAAEQTASPLVSSWFLDDAARIEARSATTTARRLVAAASLERYADEAGAPWPGTEPLRGGASTLARSNECAFLGYAELRLDATEPDAAAAGLPARTRGELLHRAAQRLWDSWRNHARLASLDPVERRRQVDDVVATVIDAELRREQDPIVARALRRERQRVVALLDSLAEGESRRTPFDVVARELAVDVVLDGARLRLRIDRIDALGSPQEGAGRSLAIFDYKTGRGIARDWSSERPDTMQWLVYLAAVSESALGTPVALCAIQLTDGAVGYSGVTSVPAALAPLLARRRNTPDWHTQLPVWRRQVAERIGRVLAGDARLDPRHDACRNCRLPILCRRAELLGPTAGDEPAAEDLEA